MSANKYQSIYVSITYIKGLVIIPLIPRQVIIPLQFASTTPYLIMPKIKIIVETIYNGITALSAVKKIFFLIYL